MTVRLKSTMAGPRGTFQSGAVVDFEADTERDLVSGGYAEYVGQPAAPVREQAVVAPVEHAVGAGNPVKPTQSEARTPQRRGR